MPPVAQQQSALVEQHRQAQVANQAAFLAQFIAAWGLLDLANLDAATPNWIRIVARLIREFRGTSAGMSLEHYRDLRRLGAPDAEIEAPDVAFIDTDPADLDRLARATTRRLVRHAPNSTGPSTPARVAREPVPLRRTGRQVGLTINWDRADRAADVALRVTGPINIKSRIARGENPAKAGRAALVDASGAAARQVANGGRSTLLTVVQNDRVALGWLRITDADPCHFCAMLASRGPVYKRASFNTADPRFSGPGQVKVHDHCACTVMPLFSREDAWPGRGREFQRLWNDHIQGRYSGADALRAFRRLHERPDTFRRKAGFASPPAARRGAA